MERYSFQHENILNLFQYNDLNFSNELLNLEFNKRQRTKVLKNHHRKKLNEKMQYFLSSTLSIKYQFEYTPPL